MLPLVQRTPRSTLFPYTTLFRSLPVTLPVTLRVAPLATVVVPLPVISDRKSVAEGVRVEVRVAIPPDWDMVGMLVPVKVAVPLIRSRVPAPLTLALAPKVRAPAF